MKILMLLMMSFISFFDLKAQEVCSNPEEDTLDLNSITKCTIKSGKNSKDKKSRQITVKVSARKRFLKKREVVKEKMVSNGKGLGKINTGSVNALTAINTAEINRNSENFKSDIEYLKEKLSKEEVKKAMRFSAVDEIPTFSKCSNVRKRERIDCFNTEMMSHIQEHFRYPREAVRHNIEGEVWVRFIIDKNGNVRNIKALAPVNGELLVDEAKRVVSKLPSFNPALKNGKAISVKYGFPIQFSLQE